ncbi:ABC transporter ATP-binding protein, partial [Mesorhizobium sp. B1-1-7]
KAPPSALPGISPSRGGDWMSPRPSPIFNGSRKGEGAATANPPLEGEMPGRAEGGALVLAL